MFEKVNPAHPDKIADRIAGAVVDLAYKKERDPKIAVEVLIGHGTCHIIAETSVKDISQGEVEEIVNRIAGQQERVIFDVYAQDKNLAENQLGKIRCGDNGIFCGMPVTSEQMILKGIAEDIYSRFKTDGKYILAKDNLVICQSNATDEELKQFCYGMGFRKKINPLGYWTGGTNVDTGATNRKLGSDMGDAVTGGGLHGKDLSKADVSVNIYAHLKAQGAGRPVKVFCAIGDEYVDGKPYSEIVEIARNYIKERGGFEKFAEWGLI